MSRASRNSSSLLQVPLSHEPPQLIALPRKCHVKKAYEIQTGTHEEAGLNLTVRIMLVHMYQKGVAPPKEGPLLQPIVQGPMRSH